MEMQVSPQARKQDRYQPEYWRVRLIECGYQSGDYNGFINPLTGAKQYPERWRIENGYGELKQFQLSTDTLLWSQISGNMGPVEGL